MVLPIVCCPAHELAPTQQPSGYMKPPKTLICPSCSEKMTPQYVRDKTKCLVCFILPIPCGSSDPRIACSKCYEMLPNNNPSLCSSCNVATAVNCKYCPECGESKGNDSS
ncbi:hypothetical protein PAEPH01_1811 [Pancytospora epiphaga]|nr:hypothetical protein PAEPH01_1811 [Pancytospora epiphaga]